MLCLLLGGCAGHAFGPAADSTASSTASSTARPDPTIEPVGEPDLLTTDYLRSRLIAEDLVAALVQLPELSPQRTPLVTDAPDSRFAVRLLGALQDAGYELRLAADGPADDAIATRLSWRIVAPSDRSPISPWTFTLKAGRVELQRRYRTDEHGVRPASTMRLNGADATGLRLDERAFGQQAGIPATAPVIASAARSQAQAIPTAKAPNLFLTGVSRHAGRLSGHRVVRSTVLVFPNDSLRLGLNNKRAAADIVARFDPARDLLSVIGCSHGATALPDGNRRLALGRAERVSDEFQRAGIRADRILDEGCWAGQGHATMPPRGVVVTHHRAEAPSGAG